MKLKFKLYPIEKTLLLILIPLIIFVHSDYILAEMNFLSKKIFSRDSNLVRLEIKKSMDLTAIVQSGSRHLNDTIESLDEDLRGRFKNRDLPVYIKLAGMGDVGVFKDFRPEERYFVVYGYFKNEITIYDEVIFEVKRIERNPLIKNTSSLRFLTILPEIGVVFIIINIIIRALSHNKRINQ